MVAAIIAPRREIVKWRNREMDFTCRAITGDGAGCASPSG
jgi:hypothetical protein